jgi:hypothetical protein
MHAERDNIIDVGRSRIVAGFGKLIAGRRRVDTREGRFG